MPRQLQLYQVDAFTETPFKGNPAGVVLDADVLTADEMQAIARELNNPETAFVTAPEGPDHDFRIRFFSPTTEVAMCGHATVAANHVRAVLAGATELSATQKTRVGLIPIEVRTRDAGIEVWMTLPIIEPGRPIDGRQRERLLGALDLRDRDLVPGAPLQIVSSGNSMLMTPLVERATLHALSPDFPALASLCEDVRAQACFAFTLDAEPGVFAHARMFAPALGTSEDPVTGTAYGPLGVYLVRNALTRHDGATMRFRARQGEAMGRPGTVSVEVTIERGAPVRVRVGGRAVVAFEAKLTLPDLAASATTAV